MWAWLMWITLTHYLGFQGCVELVLPRESTVNDVYKALAPRIKSLSELPPNEEAPKIRLVEVLNHKIERCHVDDAGIDDIHEYASVYAEVCDLHFSISCKCIDVFTCVWPDYTSRGIRDG